eukprot:scaffold129_cov254-Pinguiococcus_pyrenoidosus.AAC.11
MFDSCRKLRRATCPALPGRLDRRPLPLTLPRGAFASDRPAPLQREELPVVRACRNPGPDLKLAVSRAPRSLVRRFANRKRSVSLRSAPSQV